MIQDDSTLTLSVRQQVMEHMAAIGRECDTFVATLAADDPIRDAVEDIRAGAARAAAALDEQVISFGRASCS